MPQLLKSFPAPAIKLRVHQIRVLRAIAAARGPLDRARLATKAGISSTVVHRALGYADPEKRHAFEQPTEANIYTGGGFPSLLTLGLVTEIQLDLDGKTEIGHTLTAAGRKALEATATQVLPPPRD